MGLPRAAIHLLLAEAAVRPFSGKIATLGRQHVYLSYEELQSLAKTIPVSLQNVDPTIHRDPSLGRKGYLSDDSLYAMMGFDHSVRIDRSTYEDADEQLDLNHPETPAPLCEAFDVVLDSGTIEHIFNIGQAMKHCLKMTRPGGRIIHLTPSSNSVNHGLYSVSPTLYADFYQASGCTIEKLWLCRMPKDFERGHWQVYNCLKTDRNWLPLGRLDGSIWFTFAVVRKGEVASAVIPQQSFYVSTWEQQEGRQAVTSDDHSPYLPDEPAGTRAARLLQSTSSWPALQRSAAALICGWRRLVSWNHERRRGRIPFPFVGTF